MPSGRLTNCLEVMMQGPGTVYTYWELGAAIMNRLEPEDRLFLRLYRVDGASCRLLVEQELPLFTAGWYFHHLSPAAVYYCEIGVKEQGSYLALLRSERVTTPPAPVSYGEWLAELLSGKPVWPVAGAYVGERKFLQNSVRLNTPSWTTAEALSGMYFYAGILAG
ncbi:MAG: DUF4912 domain-containing protein [Bacillota bacterium]